jgi:N6-L-threonylcarbamoyladenine synthase
MVVLGIDTSCDDTGVGVARGRAVLSNVVASQATLHARFGGVMPEEASREHLSVIDAVTQEALREAGVTWDEVDAVAATYGPGLAGSLLVGLHYAKGLAWSRGLPFVPVHHLEGHIAASLVGGDLAPPFLCLIASGGHTVLFDVPERGRYERVGGSRDDAAGEAFDKVARLLGLPYPGGPALAALADTGDPTVVPLPVPMRGQRGYDFSFSGLKTAVAVMLERHAAAAAAAAATAPLEAGPALSPADVAAAFQARVVGSLVEVTARAARDLGREHVVVAGGVAANRALRRAFEATGLRLHVPPIALATDNGAMIALAAAERLAAGGVAGGADLDIDAAPYLPLGGAPTRPRDRRPGEG